jgi:hypothetical protein
VLRKVILLLVLLLVLAGLKHPAVYAFFSAPQQNGLPPTSDRIEREMEERQAQEANKKRQEEIRRDTQKLYQLATELKDAVDKTNENMLSLEVVKKADEVEKLAKKVKDKMRDGTIRPPKVDTTPRRPGFPQ